MQTIVARTTIPGNATLTRGVGGHGRLWRMGARCAVSGFVIVLAFAAGYLMRLRSARAVPGSGGAATSEAANHCAPGPWGELEYVPMDIAPPGELLPIRALESSEYQWLFRNSSR